MGEQRIKRPKATNREDTNGWRQHKRRVKTTSSLFAWAGLLFELFTASVFVEPDTVFDPDFLHSEMTVTTSTLRLCIPDGEDEKASDTWNDITTGADIQKTNTKERTML